MEIENGIPMPARKGEAGLPRAGDLPFADMLVGQSLFFECDDDKRAKVSGRMHAYAAMGIGLKKIRTQQQQGGVRVWRIA